ncbi:hypothetical protein GCM10009560_23970 [Nonomuraea longicatena]|uniref:Uncharacterized protein n=1 Tax=Nonomuraea longicatena TaxID=83682 RepID=A0ABP3ZL37_9ACTN
MLTRPLRAPRTPGLRRLGSVRLPRLDVAGAPMPRRGVAAALLLRRSPVDAPAPRRDAAGARLPPRSVLGSLLFLPRVVGSAASRLLPCAGAPAHPGSLRPGVTGLSALLLLLPRPVGSVASLLLLPGMRCPAALLAGVVGLRMLRQAACLAA